MSRGAKVCAQPGCPNLQPCALHAPKPWANTSARNRARSADWPKIRARVLQRARHQCCVAGCPVRATTVDHVIPVAEGGTDDPSNLAAMCAPHHAEKSKAEAARGRRRQATTQR